MMIIGPDLPETVRPLMLAVVSAVRELHAPTMPARLLACSTLEMPPAADWKNCILLNATLNVLAVSDGANWIRQDTGAPI